MQNNNRKEIIHLQELYNVDEYDKIRNVNVILGNDIVAKTLLTENIIDSLMKIYDIQYITIFSGFPEKYNKFKNMEKVKFFDTYNVNDLHKSIRKQININSPHHLLIFDDIIDFNIHEPIYYNIFDNANNSNIYSIIIQQNNVPFKLDYLFRRYVNVVFMFTPLKI